MTGLKRQREERDPVIHCEPHNTKGDSWRFLLGFFFVGFLLELHIIFVFVLGIILAEDWQCLVNFASSVLGRDSCCTQGVEGLRGFSLKFNKRFLLLFLCAPLP